MAQSVDSANVFPDTAADEEGLHAGTKIQLEVELSVLCRLLQARTLAACEFRCLDTLSQQAGCRAVKLSCIPRTKTCQRLLQQQAHSQ